jgi:hypothetical protein
LSKFQGFLVPMQGAGIFKDAQKAMDAVAELTGTMMGNN